MNENTTEYLACVAAELDFLRAENARLKNSLTELERHLIDSRSEIDRVRLAAKKQDEAKYLAYQLTDGAQL